MVRRLLVGALLAAVLAIATTAVPASAAGLTANFTCSPSCSILPGETVTFTATSNAGKPVYSWDLNNDGVYDTSGTSASQGFKSPGKYPITLQVVDDNTKQSVTVTHDVIVSPPPYYISNTAPRTGQPVVFDASQFAGQHGGVRDVSFDLNGDGRFERDLHLIYRTQITYGEPGFYDTRARIAFADGTVSEYAAPVMVTGTSGSCGPGVQYCHTTFPPNRSHHCNSELTFGVVDIIGDDSTTCFQQSGSDWTTTGHIRVNGITIVPLNGSTITINESDGTLRVDNADVQAGQVLLGQGRLSWNGLAGTGADTVSDPVGPTSNLLGFEFAGRGQIIFDNPSSDPYRARIDGFINLPEIMGDQSVDIQLGTNNANGLELTGLHVSLGTARLLSFLPIKDIHFDYDEASDSWAGGLKVHIISVDMDTNIGFVMGNLDSLDANVSGLGVQLAGGFELDSFDLHFAGAASGTSVQLGGGIGVVWGPKFPSPFTEDPHGVSLVEIDGMFNLLIAPVSDVSIDGTLKLISEKIATLHVDYRFDGDFDFELQARLPWWDNGQAPPPVRIDGGLGGFIDGPDSLFSVHGDVEACFFACLGVHAVGSSIGVAGCVSFFFGQVGGAYTWSDHVIHFPIGCDLSPYTIDRPGPHAAAAGGPRQVVLPRGLKLAGIRVIGSGGPPLIRLTGPHGESVSTPVSAGGVKQGHFWLVKNPEDNSTGIALAAPAAGTWTITPEPGSPPITTVESAQGLPPVHISAHVAGHGTQRRLIYSVTPHAGQRVVFAEEARGIEHPLGPTRGAHGVIHFAPAYGHGGQRKIIAVVTQDKLPRTERTVASYHANGPRKLTAPRKLRARRSGTSLHVSWKAVRGARGYLIVFTTVNHRRQLFVVGSRRRTLKISMLPRTDTATVTVSAQDLYGVAGRAALLRVRRA